MLQVIVFNTDRQSSAAWDSGTIDTAVRLVPPAINFTAWSNDDSGFIAEEYRWPSSGDGWRPQDDLAYENSPERFRELVIASRNGEGQDGGLFTRVMGSIPDGDGAYEGDYVYALTVDYGAPEVGNWQVQVDNRAVGKGATFIAAIYARIITTYEAGLAGVDKYHVPMDASHNALAMGSDPVPTPPNLPLLPGNTFWVPIAERFARDLNFIPHLAVNVTDPAPSGIMPDWPDGRSGLVDYPWDIQVQAFSPLGKQTVVTSGALTSTFHYLDYSSWYGRPANSALLQVNTPSVTDVSFWFNKKLNMHGYNWKDKSPFLSFEAQLHSLHEYPRIDNRRLTGQTLEKNSQDPLVQANATQRIYMLVVSDTTWNISLSFENIVDTTANNASNSPSLFSVEFLEAGASEYQEAFDDGGWQMVDDRRTHSYYDPTFFQFHPEFPEKSVATNPSGLNPVHRLRDRVVFFRVKLDRLASDHVQFSVRGIAQEIPGECRSYADCTVSSNHPSKDRKHHSANGNAERFTECIVVSEGPPGQLRPATRCVECSDNIHCGDEQYCQLHSGVDSLQNGIRYIADSTLHAQHRLCQEKSSEVLGHKCRTDSAGVFTKDSTPFDKANVMQDDTSGFAPNFGFCGEARFFNRSGVDTGFRNGFNYTATGGVYKVLWQGVCTDGVCDECVDGDSSSQPAGITIPSGRQCLNGRIRKRRTVDWTTQTLNHNSVAVMVLVFLLSFYSYQLCFGFSMMADANRHRERFGQEPMSTLDVVRTIVCAWPCCKGESPRAQHMRMKGTNVGSSADLDQSQPLLGGQSGSQQGR